MSDESITILKEIRDLLLLIAEPQLAKRDKLIRESVIQIVGRSEKRQKAVLLMDGSRNQKAIADETPMDVGNVSRLVKALDEAGLLKPTQNPEIVIPISTKIFSEGS